MKKNESSGPVQAGLFGSQAVMPHPDKSPNPVQKFLGHGENPCGISYIWPESIQVRDRKTRRLRVGKSNDPCRKKPHINGRKSGSPPEIKNLGERIAAADGKKERIVRLSDKNSSRHIFSSYESREIMNET